MRTLLHLLLLLAAAGTCAAARADFYVVVHAGNTERPLTQKEAVDLFMGRTRTFTNGDLALAFDLPRDNATRARFYQALVGMTPAQLNGYWSRLMFTGQTMPPQALPSEAVMIDILKRNPSGIGYLSHEPTDKGLRTVLVLKDAP